MTARMGWLLAFSAVGLSYAFLFPDAWRPQALLGWDHLDHYLVFIPWTVLFFRAVKSWYLRISIPQAVAVLSEVIQVWMPNHTAEASGATASLCAVLLGTMAYLTTARLMGYGSGRRSVA